MLAALLGLSLVGCAGDTLPPQGGPDGGGTLPPQVELPTTDDVLDLAPHLLEGIDEDIARLDGDAPSLTLDEVRTLAATGLTAMGQVVVIGAEYSSWENDGEGAWTVYGVEPNGMGFAAVDHDLTTVIDSESLGWDDADLEVDDTSVEVLRAWELAMVDAAEIALAARPGEFLMAIPPEEPEHVLFVVIREGDGTLVRVAFDAVTGEALNAVEPTVRDEDRTDPHDDQHSGSENGSEDETPTPCGCGDDETGSTPGTDV